jgi:tRNA pseudouridine(38-40) synthase
VSARGNALAITSSLPAPALLRVLNAIRPEVFFSAAREVEVGFRPRAARSRTYRYSEVEPVGSLAAYRAAATSVVGRLDVRSFGRWIPSDRPAIRSVDRFEVTKVSPGFLLEIQAPSFVWGMVRKLVASVRAVAAGTLPAESFRAALAGERRLTIGLAEPEPLVLWEVEYDRPWTTTTARWTSKQVEYFHAERRNARLRDALLSTIREP